MSDRWGMLPFMLAAGKEALDRQYGKYPQDASKRLGEGARFGGVAARGGAFGAATPAGAGVTGSMSGYVLGQPAYPGSRFAAGQPMSRGLGGVGTGMRSTQQVPLSQVKTSVQRAQEARTGGTQQRALAGGGRATTSQWGIPFPSSTQTTAYPLSTMSPQNLAAFQTAMGMAGTPGEWTPQGGTDQYTEQLISTMEETARSNFEQNVLPSIQQRYAVRGATGSGAYQEEMAQAETDLERQIAENAAALRYQTNQAALNRDLQAWMHTAVSGNQQLSAALQAANIPMFSYYVQPGQTGAQALGSYGQGYASGYQRQASFM